MAEQINHPMPTSQSVRVRMILQRPQMAVLDDVGRSTVRQLVADAYAAGFNDGSIDAQEAFFLDRRIEADKKTKTDHEDRGARGIPTEGA